MRVKRLSVIAIAMTAVLVACVSLAFAFYTRSISLKDNIFEISGGDIDLRMPIGFKDFAVKTEGGALDGEQEDIYYLSTGSIAITIDLHDENADNYIGKFELYVRYNGNMSVALRAGIQFFWVYTSGGVTYYPRMDSSDIFDYDGDVANRVSENENTDYPATLYYFGSQDEGEWDFEITGDDFDGAVSDGFKQVILAQSGNAPADYPKNYQLTVVIDVQAIQYNRAGLVWGNLPQSGP